MHLAKPNYAFQKRQRELAKKQKKEEKRLRRQDPSTATDGSPDAGDVGAMPQAGNHGEPVPAPDRTDPLPPSGNDGSRA